MVKDLILSMLPFINFYYFSGYGGDLLDFFVVFGVKRMQDWRVVVHKNE